MFAILFRVLAKPGKQKNLIEFLKKDCKFCEENEPRTLRFDVVEDPENNQAFYVYEAYEDLAAFEEHKRNPPYTEWETGGLKEKLVAVYIELFKGKPRCLRRV